MEIRFDQVGEKLVMRHPTMGADVTFEDCGPRDALVARRADWVNDDLSLVRKAALRPPLLEAMQQRFSGAVSGGFIFDSAENVARSTEARND